MLLGIDLTLFTCSSCIKFTPTPCNYGWCGKTKAGSVDKSVYEYSIITDMCEIERRLFNQKLLACRISGKITHNEMYKKWRRE